MDDDCDIIRLPPEYSLADRERRELALRSIAELQRLYQEEAKTYIRVLTDIEARYAPRIILVSKPGKPAGS